MKRLLEFLLIFFLTLTACQVKPGPVGPRGYDGGFGAPGPAGEEGPQGEMGPAGAKGSDGSVIRAIQFCPGYKVSYPSTFPEMGLCIDGVLYAEFYAPPDSGLVPLPPGQYKSTMTEAPCTFTVVEGCTISHG